MQCVFATRARTRGENTPQVRERPGLFHKDRLPSPVCLHNSPAKPGWLSGQGLERTGRTLPTTVSYLPLSHPHPPPSAITAGNCQVPCMTDLQPSTVAATGKGTYFLFASSVSSSSCPAPAATVWSSGPWKRSRKGSGLCCSSCKLLLAQSRSTSTSRTILDRGERQSQGVSAEQRESKNSRGSRGATAEKKTLTPPSQAQTFPFSLPYSDGVRPRIQEQESPPWQSPTAPSPILLPFPQGHEECVGGWGRGRLPARERSPEPSQGPRGEGAIPSHIPSHGHQHTQSSIRRC